MNAPRWCVHLLLSLALATVGVAKGTVSSEARCKDLLPRLEAQAKEYDPEKRIGLREGLIELREICLAPEVDAATMARAAVAIVRQGSVALGSPKEALAFLADVDHRLEEAGLRAERIEILDYTGGYLEQEGDVVAARKKVEQSLALRREIYSPASPEVADGLLNLAFFEAARAAQGEGARSRERAVALAEEALSSIQTEHGQGSEAATRIARGLWGVLEKVGVGQKRAEEILSKYGLEIEDFDNSRRPPSGHTPPSPNRP